MATLAEAVHYTHTRGVLHRDLKPGNILMQESGMGRQGSGIGHQESGERGPADSLIPDAEFPIPKITDFGLAKIVEQSLAETRTSLVLGTPPYMAPEQADARLAEVGPATDVYALGAILYELLTCQPPFQGQTILEVLDQVRSQEPTPPSKHRPRVPRDLETICLKCLHKEPPQRYPSAAALAADLRRFVQGEAIAARPEGYFSRIRRWLRRSERMRDAGILAIGANTIVTLWIANTVLFGSFGIGAVSLEHLEEAAIIGSLLLLLDGVLIWIGVKTIARSLAAIWAGLLLSGMVAVYAFAALGLPIAFGSMYKESPIALWQVFGLMGFIYSLQAAAYVVALYAYLVNRQMSGGGIRLPPRR
jgi:hypothetical protein